MWKRLVLFAIGLLVAIGLLTGTAMAQQPPSGPFAPHAAARANGRFAMLLRQFRAEEPDLPERHEAGLEDAVPVYQGARDIPAGYWVWQRPFWFVFRDGPGCVPPRRRWGPDAACGEPDTPAPGDCITAWATEKEDRKDEWLLLEYAKPVRVTSLEVHENHKAGAIAAVAILTPDGDELELWRNDSVGPAGVDGRILQIDLPLGFEVERIKIYLASEIVPGWNEIDAVGLRDDRGKVHWAHRAVASSTYADVVDPIVPAVPVVPVPMPRVVIEAPVPVPPVRVPPVPDAEAAESDGETDRLRARIAELEAMVRRLEAELARAKAGR